MGTELRAVAAAVTDYWYFRSSIKCQRAQLASGNAIEVLASNALRGRNCYSALRESLECSLRTRECTLGPRTESAGDDVEWILKRFVHSDKHSDPRRINRVVQVPRTGIDAAVAPNTTLAIFYVNVELHLGAFRLSPQRLLRLQRAPELVEIFFDLRRVPWTYHDFPFRELFYLSA